MGNSRHPIVSDLFYLYEARLLEPSDGATATMDVLTNSYGSSEGLGRNPGDVPILHSYSVLRKERFGGYVFNVFAPAELRLDHARFRIAELCDGRHDQGDIQQHLDRELDHSVAYVSRLVDDTLKSLEQGFHIYWRGSKSDQCLAPKPGDIARDGMAAKHLSAPLFVIWEITGGCNLKCRHCLSDSGRVGRDELTTSECKRLIDTLAALKVFHISISGGEPLIRKDLFELMEYSSLKNIGIELLTNGTLVNDETIRRLRDIPLFTVQVSIDGIGQTHDDFRGLPGAYERALNAVRLFRDAGCEVVVSSAVTRRNLGQIPEIIDTAIELGASAYKTTLFMPAGRGATADVDDLSMTPEATRQFALALKEKKERVGHQIVINNEVVYPWLIGIAEPRERESFVAEDATPIGCTAGNSSLYITPEGKVTPCPFLRQFVAGDIRTREIGDIWNDAKVFEAFRSITRGDLKGKCHGCELLGTRCYGGCRAAALAYSGDLYAEDPLCWK
jgi:radical SAM protein with 4Fe4S-binding SPASM domain